MGEGTVGDLFIKLFCFYFQKTQFHKKIMGKTTRFIFCDQDVSGPNFFLYPEPDMNPIKFWKFVIWILRLQCFFFRRQHYFFFEISQIAPCDKFRKRKIVGMLLGLFLFCLLILKYTIGRALEQMKAWQYIIEGDMA